MSNVYIENSTLVVPSLFFDGFAWILIINWLIIDSRGFTKHRISMHWQRRRLWRFWHYKAKFVPNAFFGNLSPQNFHPRQISLWQHDGLAILFCCRFNRGSGENSLKRPDKTEIEISFSRQRWWGSIWGQRCFKKSPNNSAWKSPEKSWFSCQR